MCGQIFKGVPDRVKQLFLFHRKNGCPYGPIDDIDELEEMFTFNKVKS